MEIQAVDIRKVNVQDQARRRVGFGKRQVLGGGPEGDDIQMGRREELLQCLAHAEMIVDHKHDMILRAHHDSLEEIGNAKLKTAPRGLFRAAQSRPS